MSILVFFLFKMFIFESNIINFIFDLGFREYNFLNSFLSKEMIDLNRIKSSIICLRQQIRLIKANLTYFKRNTTN